MNIQNNYFDLLPNELIAGIISFLPKKDGMRLGLASAKLLSIAKDTILKNINQEQVCIKRNIEQLFEMKLDVPENGANLNPEQLLKTVKSTSGKIDVKMKEFLDNIEILESLSSKNGGLSITEMFESQIMMNKFSQHKALEKQIEQIVNQIKI